MKCFSFTVLFFISVNIMSGPTLFQKGKLEATGYGDEQHILDNFVPLDYIIKWFDKKIPKAYGGSTPATIQSPADRILVLQSSTGSGKSTVLPPELFHVFFDRTRKNIAVTQPRILTSITIPTESILPFHSKEILEASGYRHRTPLQLGVNLGFQNSVITKKPVAGIIYMTVGVLTQQLNIMSPDDFMKKYSFIVVDEVHERSIETDLALYKLKKFIQDNYKHKDCPFLITMSATFDPFKFCDYLLSTIPTPQRYQNIIKVGGFSFPIESHYLKYDTPNYIQSAIDKVIEIHTKYADEFSDTSKKMLKKDLEKHQQFRDILIFVSGAQDIRFLKGRLHRLNSEHGFFKKNPILPIEVSREVVVAQSREYKNIFKNIKELSVEVIEKGKIVKKKPTRRVFVATNIAETGITIESLKHVIDTGFQKASEFNPNFGINTLVTKPITQSMAIQRRGRVGRKYPGMAYFLYTQEVFDKMQKDQYPNIVKEEFTSSLLNLLISETVSGDKKLIEMSSKNNLLTLFSNENFTKEKFAETNINIYEMDLLDLPPVDMLHYSMEKLFNLGAINANSIPTKFGFTANKLTRVMSLESIRMVISGYAWHAPIIDLVTIAAALELDVDLIPQELTGNFRKAQIEKEAFTLYTEKIIGYSYYKTDLLLNDDFIKFVLIFYEFQKKVGEYRNKLYDKEKLQTWSESHGLSINGLFRFIEIRDEIINAMSMIGLNPFSNLEKSIHKIIYAEEIDKVNYVKTLKQCTYEGYKMNIAVWNNFEKVYVTRKSHLNIRISSEVIANKMDIMKYGDSNPKYIICDSVTLKPDPKTNTYLAKVKNISVLDGYITLDINFDAII